MDKVNYSNGKIYKLVSPHTDKVYIGSTTTTLTKRKSNHKTDYIIWKKGKRSNVMSSDLFALGVDDVDIVLIEKFPCADKMELQKRERYWIEKLDCCNKNIPTRTYKEWRKVYREKNKEILKAKSKVYKEKNKEHIARKVTCECGSVVRHDNFSNHKKTKKHKKFMEAK